MERNTSKKYKTDVRTELWTRIYDAKLIKETVIYGPTKRCFIRIVKMIL